MGNCVYAPKDPKATIFKKAYYVFKKMDRNRKNKIDSDQIESYFGNYAETSAKIVMREIDIDNDGVIGMNDWVGYWEMVRLAGYKQSEIIQQLNNIQNGQLSLNFPNVRSYRQDEPRITVIKSIVDDLKHSPPEQLPFCLQE